MRCSVDPAVLRVIHIDPSVNFCRHIGIAAFGDDGLLVFRDSLHQLAVNHLPVFIELAVIIPFRQLLLICIFRLKLCCAIF